MLGLNLWDAIDPEQAGYTIPAQPTAPPMAVPAQVPQGGFGLLGSLFGGQRQPAQGFEGIPQREEPTWRERISTILSPALMQIGAALMAPPGQRGAILGNLGSVVQAGQKTLADDRLYRAQLAAWQKANTQQQAKYGKDLMYNTQTQQWGYPELGKPMGAEWQPYKPSEPTKTPNIQSIFDESGNETKVVWDAQRGGFVRVGGAKKEKPPTMHTQIIDMTDPNDPYGTPKKYLIQTDPQSGTVVKQTEIGSKGGNITPEATDMLARIGLVDLKQLPAMGFGPAMRIPVFNRMAEIVTNEGIIPEDMTTRQIVRQQVVKGAGQLERQAAQLEPFIKTFDKNVDVLENIFQSPTGVPALNRYIQAGKRAITGDPDLAAIDVAVKTVTNEFARIMTSATAGSTQMPESEIKKAEELLNAAKTPEQLKAAIGIMKRDTQNRLASFNEHRQTLKGRIEELGKPTTPANQSFLTPQTPPSPIQTPDQLPVGQGMYYNGQRIGRASDGLWIVDQQNRKIKRYGQ